MEQREYKAQNEQTEMHRSGFAPAPPDRSGAARLGNKAGGCAARLYSLRGAGANPAAAVFPRPPPAPHPLPRPHSSPPEEGHTTVVADRDRSPGTGAARAEPPTVVVERKTCPSSSAEGEMGAGERRVGTRGGGRTGGGG